MRGEKQEDGWFEQCAGEADKDLIEASRDSGQPILSNDSDFLLVDD